MECRNLLWFHQIEFSRTVDLHSMLAAYYLSSSLVACYLKYGVRLQRLWRNKMMSVSDCVSRLSPPWTFLKRPLEFSFRLCPIKFPLEFSFRFCKIDFYSSSVLYWLFRFQIGFRFLSDSFQTGSLKNRKNFRFQIGSDWSDLFFRFQIGFILASYWLHIGFILASYWLQIHFRILVWKNRKTSDFRLVQIGFIMSLSGYL